MVILNNQRVLINSLTYSYYGWIKHQQQFGWWFQLPWKNVRQVGASSYLYDSNPKIFQTSSQGWTMTMVGIHILLQPHVAIYVEGILATR